jgi:hypothetical protein
MKAIALEKAKGRLRSAKRAFKLMGDPKELGNAEDHWIDFLVAWKGTYSKVQQAAKDTPQELQWFGKLNTERKANPVLRYLFEARNDEEHGLVKSASLQPGQAMFRMTKDGPDAQLVFEDGKPAKIVDGEGEVIAELVAERPLVEVLHPVKDRGGNTIPAPTALDGSPLNHIKVAELGLRYLEALVAKAEAMNNPKTA